MFKAPREMQVCVKILLESGASTTIEDKSGDTPCGTVCENTKCQYSHCIALLKLLCPHATTATVYGWPVMIFCVLPFECAAFLCSAQETGKSKVTNLETEMIDILSSTKTYVQSFSFFKNLYSSTIIAALPSAFKPIHCIPPSTRQTSQRKSITFLAVSISD